MAKPNYGIDAAPVVRNLAIIGAVCILLAVAASTAGHGTDFADLRYPFRSAGVLMLLSATLMFLYAKFGKFRHRDRMLDMIGWKGDETVLDVGTGRGLLLIGAAKRLNSGKAVGIDIWNEQDLSGNNIENALKNAEIEGVRSRIEIRNEDARKMSFPDASFDVILSNLCLHNIPDAEGRRQACKEIARVMRPSAVALISDFKSTKLYKGEFEAIGLSVKRFGPFIFDTFPPLRVLEIRKADERQIIS